MAPPLHQYASVTVAADAPEVVGGLRTDAHDLVATATADALAALVAPAGAWGLSATALPEARARATEADELGSVELEWRGHEDTTAWPSLVGRLLVIPQVTGSTRVAFVSPRSPDAELATGRVDRLHRRRVVDVAVQRFLRDLARRLGDDTAPSPASSVGSVDRTGMFVHHLRTITGDPDAIARDLSAHAVDLADHATRAAVERSAASLAAGRFRATAEPRVAVQSGTPGSLGTVQITWHSQEEATGWPQLDLAIVVEAVAPAQVRVAALSPRPPQYDLSRNQSDKLQRDEILRHAAAHLLEAMVEELVEAPNDQAEPAAASTGRGDRAGRLLDARS